jgi:hypothetical protein
MEQNGKNVERMEWNELRRVKKERTFSDDSDTEYRTVRNNREKDRMQIVGVYERMSIFRSSRNDCECSKIPPKKTHSTPTVIHYITSNYIALHYKSVICSP